MRKYSILMSVYYKEKPMWLRESIESMLSQTVKAEEFFIVKDGPLTDELDEVIDEYVKSYPELFTILALKKNMGLGPALAEGVKKCRNEKLLEWILMIILSLSVVKNFCVSWINILSAVLSDHMRQNFQMI